ncbi:MAG TPA: hypothetical protein VHX66_01820 [Solirubrobacteraceae bacterium]|nr:hypothetical protein [Solirubrobacteraceae bacterium]
MKRGRISNRELDRLARNYDGPYRPYDLVKELCVALAVVTALALALAIVFSSPDDPPRTIKQWSHQMPVDFVTTAVSELDGSSDTAGYGPPYNHASTGQHAAFIHLQQWFGVSHPINTPLDYVYEPLASIPGDGPLRAAVAAYRSAPAKMQSAWTTAYADALGKATVGSGDAVQVAPGDYGPVPTMMSALLSLAQSGGLDGDLLTSSQFYETDYTTPLLLMADGGVLTARAQAQHLLGSQWGMMNETGSYPGQVWLWLYTFWYQIEPFSSSANADLLVFLIMGFLSVCLVAVPFIPGVRDIPRWIPLYRYIWRDHYRAQQSTGAGA